MNKDWLDEPVKMRKTVFLDIDGCCFFNRGEDTTEIAINLFENKQEIIPGTKEKIAAWRKEGHIIVITTGRPDSLLELTKEQLLSHGIAYDKILTGLSQDRYVVNDENSKGNCTAHGCCLKRNDGIKVLDI